MCANVLFSSLLIMSSPADSVCNVSNYLAITVISPFVMGEMHIAVQQSIVWVGQGIPSMGN